jgi:hypothetical protein
MSFGHREPLFWEKAVERTTTTAIPVGNSGIEEEGGVASHIRKQVFMRLFVYHFAQTERALPLVIINRNTRRENPYSIPYLLQLHYFLAFSQFYIQKLACRFFFKILF